MQVESKHREDLMANKYPFMGRTAHCFVTWLCIVMKKLAFYNEAKKIWGRIAQDGRLTRNNPDPVGFQKRLFKIFQPGDSYYFVFDVGASNFEFISPEITDVLGYDAHTLDAPTFLSYIHPDDRPWFLDFENALYEFYRKLPVDKIVGYKIRYDFRVRHLRGHYVRILHQMVILEFDTQGNLLQSLGIHSDITHLKSHGKPRLSFIGLDGEPSYVNVDIKKVYSPSDEILTPREKEILGLMIDGKQSKEIATILNITKATVDRHRKNMLEKTKQTTSAQLVAKSINHGWI